MKDIYHSKFDGLDLKKIINLACENEKIAQKLIAERGLACELTKEAVQKAIEDELGFKIREFTLYLDSQLASITGSFYVGIMTYIHYQANIEKNFPQNLFNDIKKQINTIKTTYENARDNYNSYIEELGKIVD